MNLDKVGSRRMLVHINQQIENILSSYIFEHNDKFTRARISNNIETFLQDLPICDYTVICDERNNSPEVIDGNMLRADTVIKLHRDVNAIHIRAKIHPTEVIVDEPNYDDAFDYAMKVVEPKY